MEFSKLQGLCEQLSTATVSLSVLGNRTALTSPPHWCDRPHRKEGESMHYGKARHNSGMHLPYFSLQCPAPSITSAASGRNMKMAIAEVSQVSTLLIHTTVYESFRSLHQISLQECKHTVNHEMVIFPGEREKRSYLET